jgi:hypothetical protein
MQYWVDMQKTDDFEGHTDSIFMVKEGPKQKAARKQLFLLPTDWLTIQPCR